MHIRKLELQGFKSFPNRTSFHFGRGVSGVVGPNGCGKSNVVDAVKWCLGEQSAKSLRGKSMDDIIFAGSQSRKPMGVAEVSLTFEAGGEPFAGEFARCEEIQITRRLFRDGNSEYLINQNRCRLKDIQDIFRDTGASNRLYSFIEQGRIGEIVKAKPEQRRSLIEEAAGISRYKAKKREAEQRLEGTTRNLERANDVVSDLTARLRSLKRQVGKATRYRQLRTEVRQGEIFLGVARYAGLADDRKALSERLRAVSAKEQAKRRELERQDQEIQSKRDSVEVLESSVGLLRDELGELEASRREQESARLYQGRESQQLDERIERLTRAIGESESEHAISVARREEAETQYESVASAATAIRESVGQTRTALTEADQVVHVRRSAIEVIKADVLECIRALARDTANKEASKLRRRDVESRVADLSFRITALSDAMNEHDNGRVQAQLTEEATKTALEQADANAQAAFARHEESEQRLQKARSERRDAETSLTNAERAHSQSRVRFDALEALDASQEDVAAHMRRALAVEGVMGTLADHLVVDAAQQEVVATALGDELDHILVPDAATAIRVAAQTEGRINMLLVAEGAPSASVLSNVAGDDVGRSALGHVFGDAAVVDDLASALEAHGAQGGAYIVSQGPNGLPCVVTAKGEIRVGPVESGATAALQRRRELSELREQLPALEDACVVARERVAAAALAQERAGKDVDHAQREATRVRQALGEARVAHRTAVAELGRFDSERAERQLRLETMTEERSGLDAMVQTLASEFTGLGASIEAHQTKQMGLEQALQHQQQALVVEEAQANDARQAAVLAKTELSGVEERLGGLTSIVAAARQSEEGVARQLKVARSDIEAARKRIGALASDDQRLTDALSSITERQAALREKIEDGKKQIGEARALLRGSEESIRGLRDQREASTAERMELERTLDQVRVELSQIRAQLDERYAVSVTAMLDRLERNGQLIVEVPSEARTVVVDDDDEAATAMSSQDSALEDLCIKPPMLDDVALIEAWVQRLTLAKRKLDGIGEVNLVAVQEYAEVKQRFDTLEAQRLDLEESVRSIRNTIGHLNRTCRERFRETFDRVNALFKEGYPQLVGGGQARLVLTDEDDMLETGVDIEVQPPGKRLQNLALLSGGEMAMTAIALIFALFQVKPSPFCLLDEVDAPLDEANGARFNNLLREMAKLSQFIVVTHNKKTMECVDTLYGVTMPDAGVSQLVSVKLD